MRELIVCCMCIIASAVPAAAVQVQGEPGELAQYFENQQKTVTISGRSEIKVQADHAVVEISVKTAGEMLHSALRANQDIRQKVTANLNKAGIPGERITALKFSSTPRRGLFGRKVSSYEVTNIVRVKIEQEGEFQAVAAAVDEFAEVEFVGMTFMNSEADTYRNKALEQACDDIIKRKSVYESKFAVKLAPRSLVEGNVLTQNVSMLGEAVMQAGSYFGRRASDMMASPEAEAESPFGEIVYSVSMSAEFLVIGE